MKLFVWDLHGVLEQGNDKAAIDISNEILLRNGRRERFSYDDGVELYGKKWYQYFEWLLADADREYCAALQDECFALSEREIDYQRRWLRPTPHSWEVLTAIARDHDQILISNTRSANLEMYIKMLGIERFFAVEATALAVDGHGPEAGQTKQDILCEYVERSQNTRYTDIVVIGDSPSDMSLADVAGGTTYLYTHPEFSFRDCRADFKIKDLRDVLVQL